MDTSEVPSDAFGRVREGVRRLTGGLDATPSSTVPSSEDVGAVRPAGPELLAGHHDAVADRTLEYLPRSTRPSSTGSSTSVGTRPCPSGCGW